MPPEKRARVILDTDAKNEADDQYAIVHALLTPKSQIFGLVSTSRQGICKCYVAEPATAARPARM